MLCYEARHSNRWNLNIIFNKVKSDSSKLKETSAWLFQHNVESKHDNIQDIPFLAKGDRKRRAETFYFDSKTDDNSDCDDSCYYPAYNLDLSSNNIVDIQQLCLIENSKVLRTTFHSLTRLTLSYNRLESLPESIWRFLENLEIVELNDNRLSSLPFQLFSDCRNLASLDASNNKVSDILITACVIPSNLSVGNCLCTSELTRDKNTGHASTSMLPYYSVLNSRWQNVFLVCWCMLIYQKFFFWVLKIEFGTCDD